MINEIAYKDHDEWLKIRSQYIGGSDAGAVVGLNPYVSRYELWAEKTGKKPPFEGNMATEIGSYLEDFVAKLFERETGKKVRKKNRTFVNDKYPFACANVDRLVVGEKSLVEVKTTNSFTTISKVKTGEPSDSWYAQVTHYLAVTELDKAYIAVLIGNRDFKIIEIERNQMEIDALMQAEQEFWKLVQSNTPPAPDGSDSASKTISELYPNSTDDVADLMAYDNDLSEYEALTKQIKTLTELRDEKANRVKAFMQSAGHGESQLYKVSYTSAERRSLDTGLLLKNYPKMDLSKYQKTTTVRAFKVTKKD